jgi:lipoprotein NlpI
MTSIFHRLLRRAPSLAPLPRPSKTDGQAMAASEDCARDAFDAACAAAVQHASAREFDAEIAAYDRAIGLQATRAEPHYKRANALRNLGRLEEALAGYERAIERNRDYAHAWCNRGVVLQSLGRMDAARESYDRAIALDATDFMAHYNRALLAQDCSLWDEALDSYERAIQINPGFADARYNRAMAQLFLGDFSSGWAEYEWRWLNAQRLGIGGPRSVPGRSWRGEEPIGGKRLLLYSEAGLGDTLQFCRYAISCAQLGADVTLEVQGPLRELLSALPGVARVVSSGEPLPDAELNCPLLSLPLAFKTTLATIPLPQGYLRADPEKDAQWRKRLGERRCPRVGIAWSGNPDNPIDARRSVRLADWLPWLPRGYEYFTLQRQVREADRRILAANPQLVSFDDSLLDFDNTAALIGLMDVVVSVDTSLAHLAGALGKTTWLLLPQIPDYRWMRDREDTPWYSSLKLYRQAAANAWAGVFERVSADLHRVFR